MKRYLLTTTLLLLVVPCEARTCCEKKVEAINQNALRLEAQCAAIEADIALWQTSCCNRSRADDCSCSVTSLTNPTSTITSSGYYCLANDVTSVTVTTNDGVILDLNSFSAGTVTLGDNVTVKNGVANTIVASANAMVQGVNASAIFGDGPGSSVLLIDVTGLTTLNNVERVVMMRCTGNGSIPLTIYTGVTDVTLYDSMSNGITVQSGATAFSRLALYRSLIDGNINFGPGDALQEVACYQSAVTGEMQLSFVAIPVFERLIVEESQIGRISFFLTSPQSLNAMLQRSAFGEGVTLQYAIGVTMHNCEMAGPIVLLTDENVEINNVSLSAVPGGSAVTIGAGNNILFTDCCFTATGDGQVGFMTSTGPENLNIVRCYAEGCFNGFEVSSVNSCLIKDSVCVGSTNESFNGSSNVVPLGNVALSVGGVPATNFVGAPFNPVVVNTPSVSTDDADKSIWRNMSFEL